MRSATRASRKSRALRACKPSRAASASASSPPSGAAASSVKSPSSTALSNVFEPQKPRPSCMIASGVTCSPELCSPMPSSPLLLPGRVAGSLAGSREGEHCTRDPVRVEATGRAGPVWWENLPLAGRCARKGRSIGMRDTPGAGNGDGQFETDVPARLDRLPWSGFHWRVVTALGITWVLDGLEVTLVGSLAPAIHNSPSLGLSETQIGLAASAYLVGAVCGAIGFGYLADRIGRQKLFFVTLAVYMVACILTGFSWDFWSFA